MDRCKRSTRCVLNGVFGFIALYAFVFHLQSADTFAAPKLSLHHSTYDFGYVPQRSHVSHRFWVHNDGDEPLTIDRIDVGCWCTSTSRLDDPIAPGDSAAILVTLNTTIIQGHVRKWIKLFTSIVTGEHERLWIRGYVVTDDEPTGVYRVTPPIVDWPILRSDSAEGWVTARLDRARFEVINLTNDTVQLNTLMCCTPCLDSVVAPAMLAGQAESQIVVYGNTLLDSVTCVAPSVTLALIAKDTTRITVPIVIE